MTRLLIIAVSVALTATAAVTIAQARQVPATPSSPVIVDPELVAPGAAHQVTMRLGDTMIVEDAGVGCQVTRRGGRVVVECRRTGPTTGTYMTLIGKRTAKVARFRSADAAKVIVTARQGGAWRACGTTARIAAAGADGCR